MSAEPLPARVAAVLRGLPRPVCAYVYDAARLRERVRLLRAVLPRRSRLLYAVKANGHPDVVRTLASTVDGLEVASGGELALARDCGGAGLVAFSGPAKTDAELAAAVDAGAVVHVESAHELRRLALVAAARRGGRAGNAIRAGSATQTDSAIRADGATQTGPGGRPARVALRVNRAGARLPGTHAMTGAATPFGIDAADLGRVAALAAGLPQVEVIGFHLHAASNNTDAAAHAAFCVEAVEWSVRTAAELGLALRYVNVGGGLGLDYTTESLDYTSGGIDDTGRGDRTGGHDLDLGVLGRGLRAAAAALPDGAELVLEPGRFLAADAGWYAAEVLDLKRVHGRWFAVLRGGTHHFRLPAAWGYSHPCTVLPVEEWPYPFDRPQLRHATVDVAGELCTPRDVLARDRWFDRLRVGDVLVFGRAGAYGWDISHHEFLRHPYPELVFVG